MTHNTIEQIQSKPPIMAVNGRGISAGKAEMTLNKRLDEENPQRPRAI